MWRSDSKPKSKDEKKEYLIDSDVMNYSDSGAEFVDGRNQSSKSTFILAFS